MMMMFGSVDVCEHIRQRERNHTAPVLGHGTLPHADAEGQRVHPVPPDSEPSTPAPRRVLPTCLVVHEWNRYEYGKYAVDRSVQVKYLAAVSTEPTTTALFHDYYYYY